MRLLAQFAHAHRYAYLALIIVLTTAGFSLYNLLVRWIRNRNRRNVEALLAVFDPGTAEFEESMTEYVVRGRFQGRPASISTSRNLASRVDFSIAGRFYLPFRAKTSRSYWFPGIQAGIQALTSPMTPLALYWLLFFSLKDGYEASFVKFTLVLFAIIVVAGMMLNFIGKLSGNLGNTSPSVFRVDLNGQGVRRFATYQPDRFQAAIEHSEIRKSFGHLFGSCGTDILKVPGRVRAQIRGEENWTFAVEATWLGRETLLEKETVQKMLTELSTLCADFDQFAPDPWLSRRPA